LGKGKGKVGDGIFELLFSGLKGVGSKMGYVMRFLGVCGDDCRLLLEGGGSSWRWVV